MTAAFKLMLVESYHNIAEALGHLATMGIAHDAVQEHVGKRKSVSQLQPEHHHPSDPKEEDIATRLHKGERVKALKVGGL